jgi:tRNA modification GTPase
VLTGDTIVAISTPPGSGALGIIRLSGHQALNALLPLWRGKDIVHAATHTLHVGRIVVPETGAVLDEVVASIFRAPTSYTREEVVEISCHGSPYILQSLLQLLCKMGARLAEPGEFTLRAYLNGALDLAQAEAVSDLIASRSEAAQRLAIGQLRGELSANLKKLRQQLVDFTALLELELDFSEEDVQFVDRTQLSAQIHETRAELALLLASFAGGNAIKSGIPVVIAGKPNAGKSTLLNRLLNENRAIVSDIPGTTRDVIEDTLYVGGYEFRIMDTAGLRVAMDPIEAEGVARSYAKIQVASIVLYLYDVTAETDIEVQQSIDDLRLPETTHIVVLANKSDLSTANSIPTTTNKVIPISAVSGLNILLLENNLVELAKRLTGGSETVITNQRHAIALQQADDALQDVVQGVLAGMPQELISLDLRRALICIGSITGDVTPDEILGSIFSRFCIGK